MFLLVFLFGIIFECLFGVVIDAWLTGRAWFDRKAANAFS